jgi:hypothetical protein
VQAFADRSDRRGSAHRGARQRAHRAGDGSVLPIQPGDTVDPQRLDLALKTWRTDLFADVKIEMQGGDLVVKVVENPIINQVVFEGNSSLKEDKLKDESRSVRAASSPPRCRPTSSASSNSTAVRPYLGDRDAQGRRTAAKARRSGVPKSTKAPRAACWGSTSGQ